MKQVRLYSIGEVESASKAETSEASFIDRHAMLVYPGKFESMDGPVTITDDHIQKIADNHNKNLSQLKKLSKDGEISPKNYPPIQLDHSASATMTVGRLIGELSIGPAIIDGETLDALFGTVRILGKENVEKVQDGRWTHLSIGADLDDCKLNELTITPFPAAANASLLRSKRMSMIDSFKYKENVVSVHKDDNGMFSCVITDSSGQGYVMKYNFNALEQATSEAKTEIDNDTFRNLPKGNQPLGGMKDETPAKVEVSNEESSVEFSAKKKEDVKTADIYGKSYKIVRVSSDDPKETEYFVVEGVKGIDAQFDNAIEAQAAAERAIKRDHVYGKPTKMSEGDSMDKEKLKKHLMEKEKLSEKDADEKLSKMSEEEMKKFSAESADEGTDTEEKNKKMSANREKYAKLSSGFKSSLASVKLAEKKIKISTRLSQLRSQAKITPAEIKKIDVDKLSAKSDDSIEAYFDAFSSRENVIPVGIHGSSKAMSAAELGKITKSKASAQLEQEALASMPFTSAVRLKTGKLSNAEDLPNQAVGGEGKGPAEEAGDSPAHSMLHHLENAHMAMENGNHDEAKEHLKMCMDQLKAHMGRLEKDEPAPYEEGADKRMSALSDSVKKMESQFIHLGELVESVLGIEA